MTFGINPPYSLPQNVEELTSVDEDLDSISAHIDYVQENIVELQNDLIALDDSEVAMLVQFLSAINVTIYLLFINSLLSTVGGHLSQLQIHISKTLVNRMHKSKLCPLLLSTGTLLFDFCRLEVGFSCEIAMFQDSAAVDMGWLLLSKANDLLLNTF